MKIGFYVCYNSLGALTHNSTKSSENEYYFDISFVFVFKLKII
jgi:hypothetical protein